MSTNETFARYRIGRRLGQGGMAEVHEASLPGHDGFVRKVALKRVRAELARDPELVRMFSDEARLASHLHHANLVAILDYGVHEGVPYQALELVIGASLEALVGASERAGARMPEELAIHVAREVAHGLAHAHRARDADGRALGLVHRDVSPANVLVSEGGDVKLGDFGIAFAKRKDVETAHGVARGKPSYMAPEQATRGSLDARTDLFGLGCTLHFALTGRSPLEGDQILVKLLVGEPAPLEASLADDLRALLARALAPDRRERPPSAEAFAEELDAAYRRRSARDGRAALRAWVAPILATLAKTAAAEPPRALERSDATAEPSSPAPSATTTSSAPPSSRMPWLLGALAVLGALGIGLERVVSRSHELAPQTSAPAPDAGSGDTSQRVPDALAPDVFDGPPDAWSGGAPDASRPRGRALAPGGEDARARAPEAPEPSALAPARGHGWARIVAGCERARGGAVTIDGRATGEQVPTSARLSSGAHAVRVETADGQRFEGRVTISELHTESRPAWFRACEESDPLEVP